MHRNPDLLSELGDSGGNAGLLLRGYDRIGPPEKQLPYYVKELDGGEQIELMTETEVVSKVQYESALIAAKREGTLIGVGLAFAGWVLFSFASKG